MSFHVSLDKPSASAASKAKAALMHGGMFSGRSMPKLNVPGATVGDGGVEHGAPSQSVPLPSATVPTEESLDPFDDEVREYIFSGNETELGTRYEEPGCCHRWRVKLRVLCGHLLDCCLMVSRAPNPGRQGPSASTHAYARLSGAPQYQQLQPSRPTPKFTI